MKTVIGAPTSESAPFVRRKDPSNETFIETWLLKHGLAVSWPILAHV